jgi:hypothetical protein
MDFKQKCFFGGAGGRWIHNFTETHNLVGSGSGLPRLFIRLRIVSDAFSSHTHLQPYSRKLHIGADGDH